MRRRIMAYGAAVVCAVVLVSVVTVQLLVVPSIGHLRSSSARIAAAHVLEAGTPAERARRLAELSEGMRLELTLFEPSGAVLGSTYPTPLSASPPRSPEYEVVRLPTATVVVRFMDSQPPVLGILLPLLATMVLVVVLSVPVARRMTRPLEGLAEAARRFGEGELDRRVSPEGRDEVAATARAFNAMADRIAELRALERELLANVSHELRTPMARMRVVLELLEDNPVAATRYQSELVRDLTELEALLDGIITTLRMERAADPYPLKRERLDLRLLAEEVATDFRARYPERPLSIRVAAQAVEREVDRTLVRRALMNLLENAHKYSTPASAIELVAGAEGLEVRDRGEGIETADLPRLFEPFFRVDRSRTRATGGVGLGLTFVKRVAALHGGTVQVHSEPGLGSTFTLQVGAPAVETLGHAGDIAG